MAYKFAAALEMAVKKASELAARLFNHVLNQQCNGLRWSHADLDRKQVPAH